MAAPYTRPVHDAPIYYPTVASTLYEPGDLLYRNDDGAILPASSQADQGSEPLNQSLFASRFVGVCNGKKLASNTGTDPLPVIVNQDVELTCVSSTFKVGDWVGADEAASGTALEDQQVRKVTERSRAIGVVVENYASATTKVWVRILTPFQRVEPTGQWSLSGVIQTIDMADAQVALVNGTAGAGEVRLAGNILYVDANSGATEDLLLPPEAESAGLVLLIVNTGGEDIVVKEDSDTTTIVTISTAESAVLTCNGTTWSGGVLKAT